MKRELKPLPQYRGRTVLGLLKAVKKAILEEPRRANMRVYACSKTGGRLAPACGTVGCFAGWVAILAGMRADYYIDDGDARTILGTDLNYSFEGSDGMDWYVFNQGEGDACASTAPGTVAHARAVIARIDRFIADNKEALKGRLLNKETLRALKS